MNAPLRRRRAEGAQPPSPTGHDYVSHACDPNVADTPLDPGTVVTLVYGEELFAPVQFHSFRIGGQSITLSSRPGETPRQLFRRGWDALDFMSKLQFDVRNKDHAVRVAGAAAEIGSNRRG